MNFASHAPHNRFDLVCNSQHGTVERPFEWWQTTFRESIAAIGRVALVLAPWEDPIPLTRCWCLFEIFTAVAAGEGAVELQVRLPASQRPAFVEALAGDFDVVMDTLVRVESQRAEASLPTDQERIHAAIKSSEGGHAQLDALVKDQLRAVAAGDAGGGQGPRGRDRRGSGGSLQQRGQCSKCVWRAR
jgi:hypothetical protein